jgi:hypothetical protein
MGYFCPHPVSLLKHWCYLCCWWSTKALGRNFLKCWFEIAANERDSVVQWQSTLPWHLYIPWWKILYIFLLHFHSGKCLLSIISRNWVSHVSFWTLTPQTQVQGIHFSSCLPFLGSQSLFMDTALECFRVFYSFIKGPVVCHIMYYLLKSSWLHNLS